MYYESEKLALKNLAPKHFLQLQGQAGTYIFFCGKFRKNLENFKEFLCSKTPTSSTRQLAFSHAVHMKIPKIKTDFGSL